MHSWNACLFLHPLYLYLFIGHWSNNYEKTRDPHVSKSSPSLLHSKWFFITTTHKIAFSFMKCLSPNLKNFILCCEFSWNLYVSYSVLHFPLKLAVWLFYWNPWFETGLIQLFWRAPGWGTLMKGRFGQKYFSFQDKMFLLFIFFFFQETVTFPQKEKKTPVIF